MLPCVAMEKTVSLFVKPNKMQINPFQATCKNLQMRSCWLIDKQAVFLEENICNHATQQKCLCTVFII